MTRLLFWDREYNSKENHMQDAEKNHQPEGPGKFSLEILLLAISCTYSMCLG